MGERTRKVSERGSSRHTESDREQIESPQTEVSPSHHDIESILDEIDDVLEANAEDFVRNYVQKGGE